MYTVCCSHIFVVRDSPLLVSAAYSSNLPNLHIYVINKRAQIPADYLLSLQMHIAWNNKTENCQQQTLTLTFN